jgi:hypothetical protein
MCRSLIEEAPQVYEQIDCLLSSLIACIYIEYADATPVIQEARSDGRDIIVSLARVTRSDNSRIDQGVGGCRCPLASRISSDAFIDKNILVAATKRNPL